MADRDVSEVREYTLVEVANMIAEKSLEELEVFCSLHSDICCNDDLWKIAFELVFPSIFLICKDIPLPDLEERLESSKRTFMPWRDLYYDFLYICSDDTRRTHIEQILNGEYARDDEINKDLSKSYLLVNYVLGWHNPMWCRWLISQQHPAALHLYCNGRIKVDKEVIETTVRAGSTNLMRLLLPNHEILWGHRLLYLAVSLGDIDMVALLLSDDYIKRDRRDIALMVAIAGGEHKIIKRLLATSQIDTSQCPSKAYLLATRGIINIRELMKSDTRFMHCNCNYITNPVRTQIKIVTLLLKERYISSDWINLPFYVSEGKEADFLELFDIVLSTTTFDLTEQLNETLQQSAAHGYAKTVSRLLADTRVDPTAKHNQAIRLAAAHGHSDIVHLLLSWRRADLQVNPAARGYYAFTPAAKNGHIETVRLLLGLPCVDPAVEYNLALMQATAKGHIEIVRALLLDARVDPTARRCRAVIIAAKKRYKKIFHLLLSDTRVSTKLNVERTTKFKRLVKRPKYS